MPNQVYQHLPNEIVRFQEAMYKTVQTLIVAKKKIPKAISNLNLASRKLRVKPEIILINHKYVEIVEKGKAFYHIWLVVLPHNLSFLIFPDPKKSKYYH